MMRRNFRMTNSIKTGFNITFIGAGNVAWHLAPALYEAGNHIVQIYSRTLESAQALAVKVGAKATNQYNEIEQTAHIYIYAIKDDALQWVMNHTKIERGLHLHTSGTLPISIFKATRANYGCIYPMQTFSKTKGVDLRKVSIFTEANNLDNEVIINNLAHQISRKVYHLNSDERRKLHLASVFACNFTNLMWIKTEQILKELDLPIELMHSLMTETLNKAKKIKPHNAQTGPAARGDQRVIDQHIAMLANEPDWQEIYTLLSEQIKREF